LLKCRIIVHIKEFQGILKLFCKKLGNVGIAGFIFRGCLGWSRHAVQLLTPAKIVAKTNGRDGISKVSVPFWLSQ